MCRVQCDLRWWAVYWPCVWAMKCTAPGSSQVVEPLVDWAGRSRRMSGRSVGARLCAARSSRAVGPGSRAGQLGLPVELADRAGQASQPVESIGAAGRAGRSVRETTPVEKVVENVVE